MLLQGSHAIFDFPRWARLSGVHYFRVVQADAAECVGKDFRLCGNVTVDSGLLRALELLGSAQPKCSVIGVGGWHCPADATQEELALSGDRAAYKRFKRHIWTTL